MSLSAFLVATLVAGSSQATPLSKQSFVQLKRDVALTGPVQAGILVTDIDGDKQPDILVSQMGKGLKIIGATLNKDILLPMGRSTPVVGDVDGDGKNEILVAHPSQKSTPQKPMSDIVLLDSNGEKKTSFSVPGEIGGSLVLSDLDGKGKLSLIALTLQGELLVLDSHGKSRKGFPKKVKQVLDTSEVTILSSPAVGEFDGNKENGPEIVVATNAGQVHVFRANGKTLPSFPISVDGAVLASPVIGDFDGDGMGDLLVVTGKGTVEWRKPDGTSQTGFPVALKQPSTASPAIFDLDRDGKREIYVATLGGYVFAMGLDGKSRPGWPRKVDARVSASVLVGDVNGDAVPELLVATLAGSLYAFQAGGLVQTGYPFSLGSAIYATPVLADVSRNGHASWVVARHDRKLSIVEDLRPSVQALKYGTPWATFQGNIHRTGSLGNVTKPSPLVPPPPTPKQEKPKDHANPPVPPGTS
jgi:hypothetical protein